jgi:4-oxalocrotonate tautomerase
MPLLQVTLIEGRAPDVKERLIAALTATVVDVVGVRQDSVRVLLNEVPAAHWGAGGTSKQLQSEQERSL